MSTSEAPPVTISFRHLLTGVVDEFLIGEGMHCEKTTEAVSELLVTLARYHEEGASLFPLVFVCDDRATLLSALDGADLIDVGRGPKSAETMRRALKVCAPLGRGGWSIFIERGAGELRYGVFRTDGFVLRETAMGRLRRLIDPSARLLGVVQIAENVLELRGASGAARVIYLSGARPGSPPAEATGKLVSALVSDAPRDAPRGVEAAMRTFFRRALVEVMRAPHGALVAVVPSGKSPPPLFNDGTMLDRPLSIAAPIARYLETGRESDRAAIEALSCLLLSMIGSDGVTVLGSDGAILGFNLFVRLDVHPGLGPIGGARRRTFEALASHVGEGLLTAFYRSQDGAVECASGL